MSGQAETMDNTEENPQMSTPDSQLESPSMEFNSTLNDLESTQDALEHTNIESGSLAVDLDKHGSSSTVDDVGETDVKEKNDEDEKTQVCMCLNYIFSYFLHIMSPIKSQPTDVCMFVPL